MHAYSLATFASPFAVPLPLSLCLSVPLPPRLSPSTPPRLPRCRSPSRAPLLQVLPTPHWPADGMFWLWRGTWLGLMNWRVGGLYAPGNAVFTTAVFTVPEAYLCLLGLILLDFA